MRPNFLSFGPLADRTNRRQHEIKGLNDQPRMLSNSRSDMAILASTFTISDFEPKPMLLFWVGKPKHRSHVSSKYFSKTIFGSTSAYIRTIKW
jgi:hypothetical protein